VPDVTEKTRDCRIAKISGIRNGRKKEAPVDDFVNPALQKTGVDATSQNGIKASSTVWKQ
jgi:hypothetical protein